MNKITVAIDGGAGVGKGTTAKGVAKRLGYMYIDTGAMYRAVTLYVIQQGKNSLLEEEVVGLLSEITIHFEYNKVTDHNDTFLNNSNVEHDIRTQIVSDNVSQIAQYIPVRKFLVSQQKVFAQAGGVVMEGRDIGTIIAPDAALKVHLVASVSVRAQRRREQMLEKGQDIPLQTIIENIEMRDKNDLYGENSSSKISPDAILMDTSECTIEEQISTVVRWARERGA